LDVEALIAMDEEFQLGPAGQFERLQAARVLYLARLEQHRDALAAYNAIPESVRAAWDGNAYYGLACAWSQCAAAAEAGDSRSAPETAALIGEYRGLALQMLETAWASGRLATNEQKQQLTTDPELKWLQAQDAFQAFLARIAIGPPAASTATKET
jgi:hypothetical protein